MIENNNILLISKDENATELILNKLVLLRDNDKIEICNNYKETKKALLDYLEIRNNMQVKTNALFLSIYNKRILRPKQHICRFYKNRYFKSSKRAPVCIQ